MKSRQTTNEPTTIPGFGQIEPGRVIEHDDLFIIVRDKHPVSPGHTLVIPICAVQRSGELTSDEKARLMTWNDWCFRHLGSTLTPAPDGFNIGLNDGAAAGKTIAKLHVHIIPRYSGDVPDPRGGVRWVVPPKARYWHPP